jgi:5-methylcytosine-specific restriction endonuclease McrA
MAKAGQDFNSQLRLIQDEMRRQSREAARRKAEMLRPQLVYALGQQYGYRCLCCGSTHRLTLDHIRPICKDGKTEMDNLQLLCKPCNKAKADQVIDYRPKALIPE